MSQRVHTMEAIPHELDALASRARGPDLERNRVNETECHSSTGSEATHLENTESIFSHDGVSETTGGQTNATTVDEDDDVDETRDCDTMLGCDKQDQTTYSLPPLDNSYEFLASIAPVIHFSGQTFGGDKVVAAAADFTRPATYRGQLPIKLEHDGGPSRHYHKPGTSDGMVGSDAEEVIDTRPKTEQVNASWPRPEESISEVLEVIEQAERLDLLSEPAPKLHPQGIKTPPRDAQLKPGPLTADTNSNTTGGRPLPPEADSNPSLLLSSAARKARMNLLNGELHRLMPRSRQIHFDVDRDSFSRANIPRWAIKCVTDAARYVANVFTQARLGITFVYSPGPGRKVFRIRYDHNLYDHSATLAHSFFPSDHPSLRQVRISPVAVRPVYYGGCLEYMRNILAHEFTHILGFRHYNAGCDANEVQLPSVHLPGTVDGDPDSIMYTPLHSHLWFSEDDFQVIRAVYSEPNGALVRDRWVIRDVDPYV